jgi:fibronectin-binding autotransporter adhesin
VDLSGGVLGGGGTYDIAGTLLYRGASSGDVITELGGGVNLTLRGDSFAITNKYANPDFTTPGFEALQKIDAGATLTLTDGANWNDQANLTVEGTLLVQGNSSLTADNITNTGYLAISPGSSATAKTYTQSGGTSETRIDGTLFSNVDLQGGLMHGDGTISGNLTQEGGTLHPGDSPGQLNITGDYTMDPGVFLGIDFDSSDPLGVPGVGWSFLNIGGNAQMDGTVTVNLLHFMTFHLGDLFKIAQFNSLTSNPLLTVQFLQLGGGMHFVPVFSGNELDLQVAADASAPEPGTMLLLAGGIACLALKRRKRR